jgi:hypothetical protein
MNKPLVAAPPRTSETRLDDFFFWFAASVLVTAGIIYGLKLQDDRHQGPHAPVLPPRATQRRNR